MILVTGANGMVGKALQRRWSNRNDVFWHLGRKQCNLMVYKEVSKLFSKTKPDLVIHLAARVGGVKANQDKVVDFLNENLMINHNVLKAAHTHNSKVISMLSTCIYPDNVTYPIIEEVLHDGEPHPSNYGYAYAKRMMEVQSRAYNQQYGTSFSCLIPNNMYGIEDYLNLTDGHFIPSTILKMSIAMIQGWKSIECWGDGSPMRQCTYVDDMAKIIDWATTLDTFPPMNVGNTEEKSIKEIVEIIADNMGFDGKIEWDTSKPLGQLRKPMSTEKMEKLGFDQEFVSIKDGIKKMCDWYKERFGL